MSAIDQEKIDADARTKIFTELRQENLHLQIHNATLTQQRDELLEALERVCAVDCSMGDVNYARKIITKVKGAL